MELIREIGKKGQVVIPKDIREILGIKEKQEIVFVVENNEVKLRRKKLAEDWMKNFLQYRKKGKGLTLKKLKKIEEESYDLP